MDIARINQQKINVHIMSRLLHATQRCGKITPISAVVLLFEMALKPTMRIGLMVENVGKETI